MAKFLYQVSYTAEGARGVLKEGGSARRALIEEIVQAMGGKVEAFYFAFGEDDVYVIVDGASKIDSAAVSMAVGASGAARIKTTVLLTPEEIDQAAKKSVAYRPPGA